MTENGFKHKLAAILSADVAGYSRLIAEDEVATVRLLNAYRDEMMALAGEHQGRVVDFVGDNMLAEFSSTLDAVNYAVRIQRILKGYNEKLSPERRMDFRMGVHLGDIMVDDQRIYGDGVNVAARIETIADQGGICITDVIYKQIHNKLDLTYSELGEQTFKNISEPVIVYKVLEPTTTYVNLSADKAESNIKAPLSLPEKPSLAVLPLVNLSADPEQNYFCDGLYMDIMTSLVKLSGLFLISENSMYTYKRKPVTISELGHQLGVSHVLEGGIQKAGNRVRVNVQLIEVSNGRHVWAERYDRQIDDLFAIQDEITEEIVAAMDVKLVTGEWSRRIRKVLRTASARECFYRGWQFMFGSTKEDIEEAQHMFEETIRLEPESALGYDMAGWAHWLSVSLGVSDSVSKSLEKAFELAQKSLTIEEATGFPHLTMAQIHLIKREFEQALEEIEKASVFRPGCGGVPANKAKILNYIGRPTEAIELAKRAIRITPVFPMYYPTVLARAYYLCDRHEEAIAVCREITKRDPNSLDALLILTGGNVVLSQMEEANRLAQEVLRIKPGFSLEEYAQSQPYREPQTLDGVITMLRKVGLK